MWIAVVTDVGTDVRMDVIRGEDAMCRRTVVWGLDGPARKDAMLWTACGGTYRQKFASKIPSDDSRIGENRKQGVSHQ